MIIFFIVLSLFWGPITIAPLLVDSKDKELPVSLKE